MRGKLLWVLLALSLALNLGLGGGALYFRTKVERLTGDSEARLEQVSERLGLSDDQRAGLVALREQVRGRRAEMASSGQDRRALMLAELAKSELDRTALREIMSGGNDRRAYFEQLLVDLHTYLSTLSPEQKQEFLTLAEDRQFLRRLFGSGRSWDRRKSQAQN